MTKLFVAEVTAVSHVEVRPEVAGHCALCLEHFATLRALLVDGAVSQRMCIKTTLLHKAFGAYLTHEGSVAQVVVEVSAEAATASEGFAAIRTTLIAAGIHLLKI